MTGREPKTGEVAGHLGRRDHCGGSRRWVVGVRESIGAIEFFDRGDFEIAGKKFQTFFLAVAISGRVSKTNKQGEWKFSIEYSVKPMTACWAIAIAGFFLVLVFSFLILIIPLLAKSDVQRAVERVIRDVRDEVGEEREGRASRRRLRD